ncbi:MAG TPA: FCD domain-containing protein [Terriglobales bacterium]|nr:FCD domain-containing protein [Terriglobales bacterium]
MSRTAKSNAAVPEAFIEPVRRETVMELVCSRIESLVRDGRLRCGDRLPPEPQLAKMLKVSRSSLREALKGLLFIGLIQARPGYGTYIRPSVTRIMGRHFHWMVLLREISYLEIYELRQMIEPAAAAIAADRADENDIDRMERALAAMRLNVDAPRGFHKHDIEFHQALAGAAHNSAIEATMQLLYDAMTEARLRVLPLIGDMREHWERHERMFRHIRDRQPELARRAVANDLLFAETLLRKQLESALQDNPKEQDSKTAGSRSTRTRAKSVGKRKHTNEQVAAGGSR